MVIPEKLRKIFLNEILNISLMKNMTNYYKREVLQRSLDFLNYNLWIFEKNPWNVSILEITGMFVGFCYWRINEEFTTTMKNLLQQELEILWEVCEKNPGWNYCEIWRHSRNNLWGNCRRIGSESFNSWIKEKQFLGRIPVGIFLTYLREITKVINTTISERIFLENGKHFLGEFSLDCHNIFWSKFWRNPLNKNVADYLSNQTKI